MRNLYLLLAGISFFFFASVSDATALAATGQKKHVEMRGRFQNEAIRSVQKPV